MNAGALLVAKETANRDENDPRVPEWIRRVRKLCAERGWTNRELARQLGMSAGWVSLTIQNGSRGQQPRRDTLIRIAQAFDEPVGLWFQLGGIASEAHEWNVERPSFPDFVDGENTLTADQKQVLKSLYLSWVSPTTSGRVAPGKHQRRRSPGKG